MLGVVLGKLCLQLYVSIFFPSEKLAAQILVCQSVGLNVGSSADVGCTGTCVPIGWVEVLDVMLLEELCWHTLCYNIFLSDNLAAQVLLCLPIGWVEVLEVLLLEELC